MKCYHCNGDTLRDKLINKGWVTPFNANTLVRLIEEHYAELAKPVPVIERLPGPGDRNTEGKCWWFCTAYPGEWPHWILGNEAFCDPTHWLPAHAIPLPAPQGREVQP